MPELHDGLKREGLLAPSDEQATVCKRFSCEPLPPLPMEKVGIALNTLDLMPLYAVRHPVEGGTCGWYIWGGEYSADDRFYQSLHVMHLADTCPQILPYLALPPGWGVILADGYEDVWFDKGLLNPSGTSSV